MGGNILITANFVVANSMGNSDITANAFSGSGGNVRLIVGEQIIGLTPRSRSDLEILLEPNNPLEASRLPSNDITAISQQNPSLDGQVIINAPDTEPKQQVVELPTELVTPELSQHCTLGRHSTGSRFVHTGRGGLPPRPRDPLAGSYVWQDLRLSEIDGTMAPLQPPSPLPSTTARNDRGSFVEAQGWNTDAEGHVHLVTQPFIPSASNPWLPLPSC